MVIDTSIFIEFLRAKDKQKSTLMKIPDDSTLFISTITLFELFIGANTPSKWNEIEMLTDDLSVLHFSDEIAKQSAQIYHLLKKENNLIDFRDIFIAATAVANNIPILTLNKKHFSRIKNLKLFEI